MNPVRSYSAACLGFILLSAIGVAAGAAGKDGLFTAGYLRFGAGATDGDEMTPFQLNGAGSKYRLGNETDIYGEFAPGIRHTSAGGTQYLANFRLAVDGDSNALYRNNDFDGRNQTAELWLGAIGLDDDALKEATAWGGRRFYRRRSIHISDYYYEDFSGDGIGLENIDLEYAKISTALFYNSENSSSSSLSSFHATTLDFRVHHIPLGSDWLGEVGVAVTNGEGSDHTGDDGYNVRVHFTNLSLFNGGSLNFALMYGVGAAIDFDSDGSATAKSDQSQTRFVTWAMFGNGDDFETMAEVVLQRLDLGSTEETWGSFGLRPQYNFTSNYGLAVEYGYDYWDSTDDNGSHWLNKLTIAPIYTFGKKGLMARPQLRLYATYASWDEVGAITQQPFFDTATDGYSAGIQLETWW